LVREMGDFIRCVGQSFNEMLHDENYQVGILLAIFFALLFLPIFNVQGHFALKMQIAMVIATIVSLPFLLMFVFALDNCYSLFKFFKRKIKMGLGTPRSQAEARTSITRVINAYLFNPYGVRKCYPVYFGDLNLEIKKGFGTYCQGEVEKRNFCLALAINNCLEHVDVFIVGMCDTPMAGYGEPIESYRFTTADIYLPGEEETFEDAEIVQREVVGARLTYVLGSTGEYVVVYARYDTPSPYGHGPTVIDEARRGIYPTNAVIKRFKVIDPDHAEVLDSWTCSGYECRNIEDAFRKICAGEKANTSTSPTLSQQNNAEEHKDQEAFPSQIPLSHLEFTVVLPASLFFNPYYYFKQSASPT